MMAAQGIMSYQAAQEQARTAVTMAKFKSDVAKAKADQDNLDAKFKQQAMAVQKDMAVNQYEFDADVLEWKRKNAVAGETLKIRDVEANSHLYSGISEDSARSAVIRQGTALSIMQNSFAFEKQALDRNIGNKLWEYDVNSSAIGAGAENALRMSSVTQGYELTQGEMQASAYRQQGFASLTGSMGQAASSGYSAYSNNEYMEQARQDRFDLMAAQGVAKWGKT